MSARVVYKYPFTLPVESVFAMPESSKVVHVGLDPSGSDYMPCIWVEHSEPLTEDAPRRTFQFYGTGHPIDNDNKVHVGSVITIEGLVWHVYEERFAT